MRLTFKLVLLFSLISITTLKSFGYVGNCMPMNYSNYHYRSAPTYYRTSMPNYNYQMRGPSFSNSYYYDQGIDYDGWSLAGESLVGAGAGAILGYGLSSLVGIHGSDRNWITGLSALAGGVASYQEEKTNQYDNYWLARTPINLSYESSFETGRYDGKVPGTSIQSQRISSSQAVIQ